MREIRFRAKRLDNGEWIMGYYGKGLIDLDGDKEIFRHFVMVWNVGYPDRGYFVDYEVEPSTVGQFTGLFDKTGKEIYEDDIILHGDNIDIVYFDGAWCIGNYYLAEFTPPELEKIGNRWDNPELIKEACK